MEGAGAGALAGKATNELAMHAGAAQCMGHSALAPPSCIAMSSQPCSADRTSPAAPSPATMADSSKMKSLRRSMSNISAPQTQRVGYYGDRAHRHRCAGEDRRQQQAEERIEHARGNRHADRVVEKREEQVLFDVAQRRAREADRLGDTAQVA